MAQEMMTYEVLCREPSVSETRWGWERVDGHVTISSGALGIGETDAGPAVRVWAPGYWAQVRRVAEDRDPPYVGKE